MSKRKFSTKKYRTAETHPQGIAGTAWPILTVDNAIYLDEVGAGAYIGMLSIGAVFLLPGFNVPGIHDSKKLKPHEREALVEEFKKNPFIIYHIEHINNEEFDELGGLGKAWQEGMKRAVKFLLAKLVAQGLHAECVILDGNKTFECDLEIKSVIRADSLYIGVAAAAILAKVERDFFMEELAPLYPEFEEIMKNGKGYRHSAKHDQLIASGIYTNLHRKTYNPLKSMLCEKVVTCRMLNRNNSQ